MNASDTIAEPRPAWLEQWQQHQAWQQASQEARSERTLAKVPDPVGLRLLPSVNLSPTSMTEAVSAGQIRVLTPLPVSGALSPRPVFVLREEGESWLCAPFSPLNEPAHEGEWRCPASAQDVRLSVICLWDAATLTNGLLQRARCVSTLSKAALDEASQILSAWHEGSAMPEALRGHVGPPLFSLIDPRRDYEAAVAGALEPWAELRSYRIPAVPVQSAAYSAAADSTLALAASPSGARSLEACFRLGQTGAQLCVCPVNPMVAKIRVLDERGQASALLGGGTLLFADGSRALIPTDGTELRAPMAQFRLGFAVADAQGFLLKLLD